MLIIDVIVLVVVLVAILGMRAGGCCGGGVALFGFAIVGAAADDVCFVVVAAIEGVGIAGYW